MAKSILEYSTSLIDLNSIVSHAIIDSSYSSQSAENLNVRFSIEGNLEKLKEVRAKRLSDLKKFIDDKQ